MIQLDYVQVYCIGIGVGEQKSLVYRRLLYCITTLACIMAGSWRLVNSMYLLMSLGCGLGQRRTARGFKNWLSCISCNSRWRGGSCCSLAVIHHAAWYEAQTGRNLFQGVAKHAGAFWRMVVDQCHISAQINQNPILQPHHIQTCLTYPEQYW